MALLAFTYDFLTATGSIVAAQFGQNYLDIAAVLNGGIRSENLAPDAGITSNQLSSRFAPQEVVLHLVPPVSDANIDAAPALFAVTATTAIPWSTRRIKVPAGKQRFLCGISIHCEERNTQDFEVTVYRSGSLMTGATFVFSASDSYVEQENSSLFSQPLQAFVNNDELEYRVRATTSGGNVRGVTVTEHWKNELVS